MNAEEKRIGKTRLPQNLQAWRPLALSTLIMRFCLTVIPVYKVTCYNYNIGKIILYRSIKLMMGLQLQHNVFITSKMFIIGATVVRELV